MQLILSPWNLPQRNCALEEYLLTERPGDVLLLYINRPSVIVGRHQTIEAEVDVEYCRKAGIPILKRLSGGGTVYHDEGNINYAFIVDKSDIPALDRDFATPVIQALEKLGVPAVAGPRRELLCQGLKISGTAAHITRNRQLFHGTLLHRTDLKRLERILQGNPSRRGKGVASVPSPVGNIASFTGAEEPTTDFLKRLTDTFLQQYGLDSCSSLTPKEEQAVIRLAAERYKRDELETD